MPAYLPKPLLLVQLSGFFEIGLGALILSPRYRKLSGLGLIALLIAVLPANIQMAFHANLFPDFNATLLWLRIPLQFILMIIVYQITNRI